MWLSDSYEVPQELVDNPPSPEFRQFLLNWFGSNRVDEDVKFRSATCLAPDELTLARELMRRNLKTRHIGIIHGTWILGDTDAIPLLRDMFGNEPDESRRLTIAGALWKGQWALMKLNHLETGRFAFPPEGRPPSHYRQLRNDRGFRELMVKAVHRVSAGPPLCL